MTLESLAQELRDRLRAKGLVPDEVLKARRDSVVVASFAKCSGCGQVWVSDPVLVELVRQARSAEHFLELVKSHASSHNCRN